MFGALSFGGSTFGAKPFVGPLVVSSSAVMVGEAVALGGAGAYASSGALITVACAMGGSLAALISSGSLIAQAGAFTPSAVSVFLTSGKMTGRAEVRGFGSSVMSSASTMFGEAVITGYQLRAYDQLFPASVINNDMVQIGRRLYVWKSNTGRWQPAGPAP